jgi:hypothetical protein
MIALTLDEISDIILLFKVPTKIKNFTLYTFFFGKIKKKSAFKCLIKKEKSVIFELY